MQQRKLPKQRNPRVKDKMVEKETYVDTDTGEVLHTVERKISYLTDQNDEFLLLYIGVLIKFEQMNMSEIRVYGYLLRFAGLDSFSIGKSLRGDISAVTGLKDRTVYNTVKSLVDNGLLCLYRDGSYQVNPDYAYRGSRKDRNNAVRKMLLRSK